LTSFDDLIARWNFQPIRDCPGRYVLRGESRHLTPADILGSELRVLEYQSATTQDRVLVTEVDGGALMTFAKLDGTFVHTLNTLEGLQRRLRRFGIEG
jgi:hypothetical protein